MRRRLGAAAVATSLLVLTSTGCAASSRGHETTAPSARVSWVGRLWQLTEIDEAGHLVTVPASMRATLQLTRDGEFVADDTVNALSGAYRTTRTGFRVMSAGSTAIAYAGTDPTKLNVIAAIDEVGSSSADVTAEAVGAMLRLTVSKDRLAFRDLGPAVGYPSAPPTPTGTDSHS